MSSQRDVGALAIVLSASCRQSEITADHLDMRGQIEHFFVALLSHLVEDGEPFLRISHYGEQVEWLSQGTVQLCAFQLQVRKHISDELTLQNYDGYARSCS